MKQKLGTAVKRCLPTIALAGIGALGGYLYYRFVGCASGTCAITSNPYISTLYGAVMGGLIGSLFTRGSCCACAADRNEKDDAHA